jgi:hypothetical protein
MSATTNGRFVKTYFDGIGRAIKVESGHGSTVLSIVETVYEPCACSPVGKVNEGEFALCSWRHGALDRVHL